MHDRLAAAFIEHFHQALHEIVLALAGCKRFDLVAQIHRVLAREVGHVGVLADTVVAMAIGAEERGFAAFVECDVLGRHRHRALAGCFVAAQVGRERRIAFRSTAHNIRATHRPHGGRCW